MPLIISSLAASLETDKNEVIALALKKIKLKSSDVLSSEIYKTSLDARHKNNFHFVHSVIVNLANERDEKIICDRYDCCSYISSNSLSPVIGKTPKKGEIVIAGFGPAGMFAALVLAEYGYKPIIFEKGESIEDRVKNVSKFWQTGELNTSSNVQFGEGGAGTFSDGKLTTRINDPLCRYVLEKFVQFGAPKEIMTKSKPHIGTDNLRNIVKNIREYVISLDGKIYFNSEVNNFKIENSTLIKVGNNDNAVNCAALILAIGHSARNTFSTLLDNNVYLESKAFSVGARIEHLQDDVNFSLYGIHKNNPLLPVGEYQLSYRDKSQRAVYTFCMCPGGFVVPAASENGGIVTNGMSEYNRNQKNANAALVVSVSKDDFGNGPLAGMDFAKSIEQKAYNIVGNTYHAPACTVDSFLTGNTTKFSKIIPSYSLGVTPCNLHEIFPPAITDMMKTGLYHFSKKMKCYGDKTAVLTAPETRTSSPVRITRNENFESVSTNNIFPAGEGAGYAGGIMSAAVDGIKVALKIMENFAP